MPELTDREKTILFLASATYAFEANRERAVWDELGISMFAFWRQVNALLDTEAALAHDPLTVKRLLARRNHRAQSRVRTA